MNDAEPLNRLFEFHGHRCWASTVGMRAGPAALRALGVAPSGGKSVHAIVEIGDHHGAMCFADGIQLSTQCTFGKGNVEKSWRGKLAVTLIDTAADRRVRVSYRPSLQPQIQASAFMRRRAAGVAASDIPDAEQWELVRLIWDAAEEEILSVGPVEPAGWKGIEEVVRFAVCPGCEELVAEPYLRIVKGDLRCLDCAGYPA
jgi:formylmethanofuran dehydrogenase subunit E